MQINLEFLKFHIQDKGIVHCKNERELRQLLSALRKLHFKIGYKLEEWLGFLYVGLGQMYSNEIHSAASAASMGRDRICIEFSDLVDSSSLDELAIDPRSIDTLF